MKILLLEDDQILSDSLADFLERQDYDVDLALSMQEAENLTFSNTYDLYLLDINLPDGSGLDLLKALRHAEDTTPTIFITALSDMDTLSKSFKLGAMDYIKKPFNPMELLIRIDAKFVQDKIIHQHIEFDQKANVLRKDGKIIDIGNVPYRVFTTLISRRGEVVTKDILYECLDKISDTGLRVAITKIKQKLEIDIKNIRGKGYIIEEL